MRARQCPPQRPERTLRPPVQNAMAAMFLGRQQLNATLLPDETVLVTGGSSAPGFDAPIGAALHAEVWDPATEA
jgi:hypothetical protein